MQFEYPDSSWPRLALADVSDRVGGLAPGRMLTLIGLDADLLRQTVATRSGSSRRLLQLDIASASTATTAIAAILDDLSALAMALWPDWYRGADASDDRVATRPWRRAAGRLAAAGRPP